MKCSELVAENKNKIALEYGPFVYAFEEADNKERWEELKNKSFSDWSVSYNESLLGGVNTLNADGFTAIPYYSWSNRGIGKMMVWFPEVSN